MEEIISGVSVTARNVPRGMLGLRSRVVPDFEGLYHFSSVSYGTIRYDFFAIAG